MNWTCMEVCSEKMFCVSIADSNTTKGKTKQSKTTNKQQQPLASFYTIETISIETHTKSFSNLLLQQFFSFRVVHGIICGFTLEIKQTMESLDCLLWYIVGERERRIIIFIADSQSEFFKLILETSLRVFNPVWSVINFRTYSIGIEIPSKFCFSCFVSLTFLA